MQRERERERLHEFWNEKSNKNNNKTDTGSRVCGDYILIFREWKRLIDRMTDKNTAR